MEEILDRQIVWKNNRDNKDCNPKTIFNIAIPIILSSASVTLLNIVDTIMIGQYRSSALAAIGIAGSALGLFSVFTAAMGVGLSAAIAQSNGAKTFERSGKLAWTGLAFGLTAGFFLLLCWTFITKPILSFMGAQGEMFYDAKVYLSIVKFTLIFSITTGMWNSILSANAYTRPLFYLALCINIIHLGLNYLLIYGNFGFPELGVAGAAYSSLICAGLNFFIAGMVTLRKKYFLKLNYTVKLREMIDNLNPILRLSLPTMVEWGVWTGGMFYVNKFIVAYGASQVALFHIGMKIQAISMLALSGFSTASITLVGNAYGEKNAYSLYTWNKKILSLAILVSSIGTAVCFIFPDQLMSLFLNSKDISLITVNVPLMLVVIGILIIFRTINFISSSALRAVGDVSFFLKVQPVGFTIVLFFSWLFLNSLNLGVLGVLYAMLIDESIRAGLLTTRFKTLSYRYFLEFHTGKVENSI